MVMCRNTLSNNSKNLLSSCLKCFEEIGKYEIDLTRKKRKIRFTFRIFIQQSQFYKVERGDFKRHSKMTFWINTDDTSAQ
jgi:hypothetical protein